jgi:hypothetical protein
LGVGWIRHTLPSHRSAKIPNELEPTAVHAEDDLHATPLRLTPVAPTGLGVGSTRHARPSHRSASATCAPEPVVEPPTATHDAALQHDTPERNPVRTDPFGLATIDQPATDAFAPPALATPANDPTTTMIATSGTDRLIAAPSSE